MKDKFDIGNGINKLKKYCSKSSLNDINTINNNTTILKPEIKNKKHNNVRINVKLRKHFLFDLRSYKDCSFNISSKIKSVRQMKRLADQNNNIHVLLLDQYIKYFYFALISYLVMSDKC